jgi:TatD DNase family protein
LLVDTHCHLNFDLFDQDRGQVVARARQAGVEYIVNPGVDLETSRSAVQLAARYPEVYAAVGIHPNDINEWDARTLDQIKELAGRPKVVAIGEIGLDYYRDTTPHELQKQVFQQQLELAAALDLPVIIHSRNASPDNQRAILDILDILETWQAGLERRISPLGVLHSFSAGLDAARNAIKLNFLIGITGPVTFRNAPQLRNLVQQLPLEKLVIETDAPFLTPHPYRGKRNEPGLVKLVAEKLAEIHDLPFDEIALITKKNAGRLFNWQVNH